MKILDPKTDVDAFLMLAEFYERDPHKRGFAIRKEQRAARHMVQQVKRSRPQKSPLASAVNRALK